MNAPNEEKAAQDLANALKLIKEQEESSCRVKQVFFRYHSTMNFLLKEGWRIDNRGGCDYFIYK
jgi:hypothetical protein